MQLYMSDTFVRHKCIKNKVASTATHIYINNIYVLIDYFCMPAYVLSDHDFCDSIRTA